MSVRALDFDRRGDDVREELPREEAVREEAPREDRDPADLLLPLADLDASLLLEALLLLEPLVLLELPAEPLFDLLLPDRAFAEDDRAPDEREELLFFDLPLDFEGMGISFSLCLSCAMNSPAPQDANTLAIAGKYLPLLCVPACRLCLDRSNDSTGPAGKILTAVKDLFYR